MSAGIVLNVLSSRRKLRLDPPSAPQPASRDLRGPSRPFSVNAKSQSRESSKATTGHFRSRAIVRHRRRPCLEPAHEKNPRRNPLARGRRYRVTILPLGAGKAGRSRAGGRTGMVYSNCSHPYFAHDRLDVYRVACEALALGDALCRRLPRGYAPLADQIRRALLSLLLNIAEAASRSGADRVARFRTARGECSEAAAAAEAMGLLQIAPANEVASLRALL